jgi:hypothetical protein
MPAPQFLDGAVIYPKLIRCQLDGGCHGAALGDGFPHVPSYRGVRHGILALSSNPVREDYHAINRSMRVLRRIEQRGHLFPQIVVKRFLVSEDARERAPRF